MQHYNPDKLGQYSIPVGKVYDPDAYAKAQILKLADQFSHLISSLETMHNQQKGIGSEYTNPGFTDNEEVVHESRISYVRGIASRLEQIGRKKGELTTPDSRIPRPRTVMIVVLSIVLALLAVFLFLVIYTLTKFF